MAYNAGITIGGQYPTTINTGSQVGVREELSDLLAVVDAKSTPFVSMAKKGKDIGNMVFGWQVDNFATPAPGGVADGTDLTMASVTNPSNNRTRLGNYAEVFRRDMRVGFVANKMNVAGVGQGEVARGISKRLIELKRDMETTFLCINQSPQAETSNTAPYMTSSLGIWVTTNDGGTATIGKPPAAWETPSASKTTTATTAMTETTVQDILTSIYGQTGTFRDYDLICGTTLKRGFTALTTTASPQVSSSTNTYSVIRTFSVDTTDMSIYKSSIDIFEGDFGRLILHPDTFSGAFYLNATAFNNNAQSKAKGFVIPMDLCEIRYAQLPSVDDIPNLGGGPVKLVQAIAGLVVGNPTGFGVFNATS